jgi:8-oxo-dGTP pyrophosphatase MutT (NUDIX family)
MRDAAAGPEVLMLKRHGLSDVHGGAFVFPGGKVDADDRLLDAGSHLDAREATLHDKLGDAALSPADAMALHVAALREAFEESGLLMAEGIDDIRLEEARALHTGGMGFNAVVARLGLRLRVGELAPWSRWITPVTSPKRFDTWFFVACAPRGLARHDDHETTEALWLRPRDALEAYWRGDMPLAPPQIMTLAHLSRHGGLEALLAEARSRRPPTIQPHVIGEGDGRLLCYPGHADHAVPVRAMPGPLHLVVRGKRYEPPAGFEAFFA